MRSLFILVVAASLLLLGCGREVEVSATEIARVGEHSIDRLSWSRYLVRHGGTEAAAFDSRVLSRLMDQYLEERLVLLWAIEEGWIDIESPRDDSIVVVLDRIADVQVTVADERRWIGSHGAEFEQPESVRLLHVLRENRGDAERVRQKLVERRSLEDEEFGEGEEELRVIAVSDLPAMFAGAVEGLSVGEVTDLISTSEGHHVLLVDARFPARHPSADDMSRRAREALRREYASRRLREVVLEARDRYNARVWPQNLPFEYQGIYSNVDF